MLVTGLCRIYARRGLKVFPFKSQNMALNSFVTPWGEEIGRAQALQACAAQRDAEVGMNPILIKPEGDSKSQIVLMGKPWKRSSAGNYYREKEALWETVAEVLEKARRENDLIIAEGAGSPAEINLKQHEIVNMKVALHLKAPVLLTADIDRGGVFAFLYGTLALLEKEEQELIKGFIINKFRGDVTLLQPGLEMLSDLTGGRPTVGVVPFYRDITLAREDSVFLQDHRIFGEGDTEIVVISLPHISNYDDFDALLLEKGVRLRFVSSPSEMGDPSAIIIPGSKTTRADLAWMEESGLADAIRKRAARKTPVAGICGGYQILGKKLEDPEGVEGDPGTSQGLGLLDISTRFLPGKETRPARARVAEGPGFLAASGGIEVEGYEIHSGLSRGAGTSRPLLFTEIRGEEGAPLSGPLPNATPLPGSKDSTDGKGKMSSKGSTDGAVSPDGHIWGTYLHGIFDLPGFRRAWLRSLGWNPPGGEEQGITLGQKRERELEKLADRLEEDLDMHLIDRMIGL